MASVKAVYELVLSEAEARSLYELLKREPGEDRLDDLHDRLEPFFPETTSPHVTWSTTKWGP